jgi:DNA-binding XRE family transcriptional regulator
VAYLLNVPKRDYAVSMAGKRKITPTKSAPTAGVSWSDLFVDRGKEGIAYRLTLTRQALGYDQSTFAKKAGIAANTYNQYENGKNAPDMERANALCDTYRLTLDWIFRGDTSSLRRETANTIDAIRQLREQSAN